MLGGGTISDLENTVGSTPISGTDVTRAIANLESEFTCLTANIQALQSASASGGTSVVETVCD